MADQFADLFSRIIQQQQQQQRDEEDESEEEANPGDLFQHIFNQHPLFTNHVGGVIQFPINQHGRHPHRNRGGRFPQHDDNSLVRTDNTLTYQYGVSPAVLTSPHVFTLERSFFEIEIIATGIKGSIAIGLVPDDYRRGNQPGWQRQSIGYHADDGGIFIEHGRPAKIKEKCGVGDRMGCGIEMRGHAQFVYFTKNGQTVAEQPFGQGVRLYPCVGLNSAGEVVQLLDPDLWGAGGGGGDGAGVGAGGRNNGDNEMTNRPDVTIANGHMSFLWKDGGSKDAVQPGTVPLSREKSYFEIEIFAMGENENVSIGLVPIDYPTNQLPGWRPRSVGFYVADGHLYSGRDVPERAPGEKCTVGDKIGCGLDFEPGGGRNVYFTKNGAQFLDFPLNQGFPESLYPVVVMRSAGKTVSVCVQDFETWGYKSFDTGGRIRNPASQAANPAANARIPKRQNSAISINQESSTASLEVTPGKKSYATYHAIKPFSDDLCYFEVEYISGDAIVIGAIPEDYKLDQLPGWHRRSIGYHSDNGGIYRENVECELYVARCDPGDTLGCGVTDEGLKTKRRVYFTRNGTTVAEVVFGDPLQTIYPAIGIFAEREAGCAFLPEVSLWEEEKVPDAPAPVEVPAAPPTQEPSSLNAGGVLDQIEKELTCPICWSLLVDPKIFPCQQHSFCLGCLQSYAEDHRGARELPCPVCRKNFPIPPRGVAALENNTTIGRLKEIYEASKKQ